MPDTPDLGTGAESTLELRKKRLKHHAVVVREYAKWSLLHDYQFTEDGESYRRELITEFFTLGTGVKLTERDMVLMLLGGLFPES